MTEKQKRAILLLNGLTGYLSHDEYFLLLDFIVEGEKPITISSQLWYDNNKRSYEPPITVIYGCPADGVITTTDCIQRTGE